MEVQMNIRDLPRGITQYVSSINVQQGRFYALCQDGRFLVVQAPAVISAHANYETDPEALKRADRWLADGLELIVSRKLSF